MAKAERWLKALKIRGEDGRCMNHKFQWINGVVTALHSAQELTHELHSKFGFSYFLTRRLCQVIMFFLLSLFHTCH